MLAEAVAPVPSRLEISDRAKSTLIRKVAVLGAGTMGSRIAAHLANAGVPVVLLDIPAGEERARNAVAMQALEAVKKAKPAALFHANLSRLVTIGNFEDHLNMIADCDWIIEAVTENLEVKRALLGRVNAFRRKDAIVTTNTSGLPVGQIAESLPEDFRRNWFGTHFFNPPRYMRLLEIIPTPQTDPAAISAIERFADLRLGKSVVVAKDTPNFIANRIGAFALVNAMRVMQAMNLTIEQVDALTGTPLGWPKTGVFRLADMVGLDVLGHVVKNFATRVKDERGDVVLPDFVNEMIARNWIGDKVGEGFYKRKKDTGGKDVFLCLDWKTLEYHPSERAKFASLEMAKNLESVAERVRMLLAADPKKDPVAAFSWRILPELWNYAAHRIPEISDTIIAVDQAMKAGFNWELGPFELWDAAGVPETVERMKASGTPLAPAVKSLLDAGHATWYRDDPDVPSGRLFFDIGQREYSPVPVPGGVCSVQVLKKAKGVVSRNAGASLIDLGDGIACLEFHTKMNAIGAEIVSFVTQTLKPAGDAVSRFEGFVISGDAADFSVGANLLLLLLSIQEQEWDEIDLMIKAFQTMTQTVKYCPRPVVAAPFGMCLGGGAEICLHAAARQAHAELYLGLVETGVGLIPAGGGCKEMTLRAVEQAAAVRDGARSESVELVEMMRRYFETIAMAKVSTSAVEARHFGYLSLPDGITMNRGRLIRDAKAQARQMADRGYTAPVIRTDIPVPGENMLATLKTGVHMMRKGEYISDHDAKVGNAVAHVLCGGSVTPGSLVSEQYLLDLEREAFLSLCGEKKTQERIAFTLKTGKPLRN
jgi:3-hydroxyacyl-CoA dehydrogenase